MDPLRAFSIELPKASSLATKLWNAAQLRRSVATVTDAIRLHDVNADRVCRATIECFGAWAVVNTYDDASQEAGIAEALIELGAKGVYVKRRTRTDLRKRSRAELTPDAPLRGSAASSGLTVTEHGLEFRVRLDDGFSTGLFLDQRVNRQKLRSECRGARVLNLFCYTGAYSVSAAAGDAMRVTSVDLSASVLARLSENVELNGQPRERHRVLKADAVKWLRRAVRRDDSFERIILDPPSFASVGQGTFSVAKDYVLMVTDCLRLLPRGGRLIAVTNHQKTTPASFEQQIREAAAAARAEIQLTPGELPLDCAAPSEGQSPTKSAWVTKL